MFAHLVLLCLCQARLDGTRRDVLLSLSGSARLEAA